MRNFSLPAIIVLLFGISLFLIRLTSDSQLPDPNDPTQAAVMTPDVLEANLKAASLFINDRVLRKEITDEEGQSRLSRYANSLTQNLDLNKVGQDGEVYKYGDVFRTARRWDLAAAAYTLSLQAPESQDRVIQDTLRLAQAEAHKGNTDRALELPRRVFDVPPNASAPILTAVLLEIAPATMGKGSDAKLAKLLVDAVDIQKKTIVNEKTVEGKNFIFARPFHMRNALSLAAQLYRSVGDQKAAKRAEIERDAIKVPK